MNLLFRLWFDAAPHNPVNSFAPQHKNCRKDFTGELFIPYYLIFRGRIASGLARRAEMAWKTPKIVEVPVGMEINMYACAARK